MSGADSPLNLDENNDFDALRARMVAKSPAFAGLWKASAAKRSLSLALVGLRRAAGLTQADLAARTGWNKAFISRLEGALGGLPSTATIARYAEACGAVANVAFTVDDRITEVVPLAGDGLGAAVKSPGHARHAMGVDG